MTGYVGRFAPSPTGPLHFGSLLAALASWLDARAAAGRWLVRIEDLDEPRNQPGAGEAILRTLDRLGLYWDGPVLRQSERGAHYRAALEILRRAGLTYPCGCSRKEIADSSLAVAPDGALVYPGTCRGGLAEGRIPRALRMRTEGTPIVFEDRVQGTLVQSLAQAVGDFVIWRADGQYAYQLAVVVDDAEQGITDVVRGADLLHSSARQIHLQRALGYAQPRYAHIPVAVDRTGAKLSKQTGAPPIALGEADAILRSALGFLGLAPPPGLPGAQLLDWATRSWRLDRIPRVRSLPVPV